MAGGRPTEYRDEYCEQVIAWGEEGKSLTWMAATLDVSRDTIYEWIKVYPKFSDAITRAKLRAQKWWEDAGQSGLVSPVFNASVYAKSMAARFPEEWRDNSKVELTGANGGAVQNELTIRFEDGSGKPPG